MKQFISELVAFVLFLISILWILATAGASDMETITIGQCIWRLAAGAAGLFLSVIWINWLAGKEGGNEQG
jgi:hypothetical protein